MSDLKATTRIRTPHAAVLVWNYNDRLGSDPTGDPNVADEIIISTLSLVSIRTNKAKSDPQGVFQLTLAPTKNWVSTITPGSWCAILMSNKPITKSDFESVDPGKLKMIGKIDTVRVGTSVDSDGARQSMYYVTGVDWAHIFNNIIYIDPGITGNEDPQSIGNSTTLAILKILFGPSGIPVRFTTATNIDSILKIFGKGLFSDDKIKEELNLLANAIYDFNIPVKMSKYLKIISKNGKPNGTTNINGNINLITGALGEKEDVYEDTSESYGFIDPFSLSGTHSFWQVLLDNSNPTMNEMIAEMRPGEDGTRLNLYNRIKPFAINNVTNKSLTEAIDAGGKKVVSYFQSIKTHEIDPMVVIDLNAGTNWKDKYNFVEIKPSFSQVDIFQPLLKKMTQSFDDKAFQREGFRPLIFSTKHFPGPVYEPSSLTSANWNEIEGWVKMLKVWYFDTHKMLNGTMTLTGIDGYIAVGDNIQFDIGLINPNKNFSIKQAKSTEDVFILAHVENISHSFGVDNNGSRAYRTTISFVRGIMTDKARKPIIGDAAAVDAKVTLMPPQIDVNARNTISVSDNSDPDVK